MYQIILCNDLYRTPSILNKTKLMLMNKSLTVRNTSKPRPLLEYIRELAYPQGCRKQTVNNYIYKKVEFQDHQLYIDQKNYKFSNIPAYLLMGEVKCVYTGAARP